MRDTGEPQAKYSKRSEATEVASGRAMGITHTQ